MSIAKHPIAARRARLALGASINLLGLACLAGMLGGAAFVS